MIYPTATDLLGNIEATIVARIEPDLQSLGARSAAATVKHMLRHVKLRITAEGRLLAADIVRLRATLADVRAYFTALPSPNSASLIQQSDAAVAASQADPDSYRGLDELAEIAGALREALYQALKELVRLEPEREHEESHIAIRALIRDYIVWQVEREESLIADAFFGKGPRR